MHPAAPRGRCGARNTAPLRQHHQPFICVCVSGEPAQGRLICFCGVCNALPALQGLRYRHGEGSYSLGPAATAYSRRQLQLQPGLLQPAGVRAGTLKQIPPSTKSHTSTACTACAYVLVSVHTRRHSHVGACVHPDEPLYWQTADTPHPRGVSPSATTFLYVY